MSNIKTKLLSYQGLLPGIGEATANELASKGAKVILAARRELDSPF